MSRSIRTIALVFIATASFLVSGLASAQFNQHYQETTFLLNQSGAQPTIAYFPIPRTGWPVRVELSAVDPTAVSVQAMTSFTIVDGAVGNPKMTVPSSVALTDPPVTCVDNGPDAVVDCSISGSVSVGYTDTGTSGQPHRVFVKLFNCNCASLFRISVWY